MKTALTILRLNLLLTFFPSFLERVESQETKKTFFLARFKLQSKFTVPSVEKNPFLLFTISTTPMILKWETMDKFGDFGSRIGGKKATLVSFCFHFLGGGGGGVK